MNKKRRLNELYKGVFKNDKKSCVVDLKPQERLREFEANIKSEDQLEKKNQENKNKIIKPVSVNLKVGKNLGFGSFFQNVREEVVQIFTAKEEYISFEDLVNSSQINQLFNGNYNNRDSTTKKLPVIIERMMTDNKENENFDEEEEILYEDENQTIFKRKKPQSRRYENYFHKPAESELSFEDNHYLDIAKIKNTNTGQDSELSQLKNNFQNNQFIPKGKNIPLQESCNFYKEVKSRRNKHRQESSTNSENINFLNFTDGRNLN